jgi:TonB family protein
MGGLRGRLTCALFLGATSLGLTVTSPLHADTAAADIFKRVAPAVVLIGIQGPGDSPAFGSGVVLTRDALIATNHHVVKDAKQIVILMSSEEVLSNVALVAEDPTHDLAILLAPGLVRNPPLLADSTKVEVGDDVLAIGHPEGLTHTLSKGLVSALRDLGNGRRFIQTTVPISLGSSGGPLLNMRGEVIGLTVGFLPEGQNLNFAIPSNDVRRLLNEAKAILKAAQERIAREKAEQEAAQRRAEEEARERQIAEAAAAKRAADDAAKRQRAEAEAAQRAGPTLAPIRLGRSNTPGMTATISLKAGDFPFRYHYLRLLQSKLSERWTPPPVATRIGEQATILVEIGSDGQIAEPVIVQSSGNRLYEQSTLRAIIEASPFPPLPTEYKRQGLRVGVSFVLEAER